MKIHSFQEPLKRKKAARDRLLHRYKPEILALLGTPVVDNERFFTDIYLAIRGLSYFFDLSHLNNEGLKITTEKHLVEAEQNGEIPPADVYVSLINPLTIHLQMTAPINEKHFVDNDIKKLLQKIPYVDIDQNGTHKSTLAFMTLKQNVSKLLTITEWHSIVLERIMDRLHFENSEYAKALEVKWGVEFLSRRNEPIHHSMTSKL